MIQDGENFFTPGGSSGQSLNGFPVGTTSLGNTIDAAPLGSQNVVQTNVARDFGMGYPQWLYMLFLAAPTSGGAATIDIQLVSSLSPVLTSPNIMADLTGGPQAYNGGRFAAGTALRLAMPRAGIGGAAWLRYIGVNLIVGTAALSGGTLLAYLTRENQDSLLSAVGYLVS